MSFHQWLRSTSTAQRLPSSLENENEKDVNQHSLLHPTMTLSHVENAPLKNAKPLQVWASIDENEYHEAMQRKTQAQWSQQLSTHFAPKKASSGSRDKLPSLAATHPSNYNGHRQQTLQNVPLPSLPPSLFPNDAASKPVTVPLTSPSKSPSNPLQETHLHVYNDPMLQTSLSANYLEPHCKILKRDTDLAHGNVISPTWMVGLPLGGMVEMAHYYPSKDGRAKADRGDESE